MQKKGLRGTDLLDRVPRLYLFMTICPRLELSVKIISSLLCMTFLTVNLLSSSPGTAIYVE